MSVQDIMPVKGIKVKIGDEDHTLRFTMRSLAWLAEKYGSVTAALEAFDGMRERGMGVKELTAMGDLTYASLLHENGNITPQSVMDTLDIGDAIELIPSLMAAYMQAMGQGKKIDKAEEIENPPKA